MKNQFSKCAWLLVTVMLISNAKTFAVERNCESLKGAGAQYQCFVLQEGVKAREIINSQSFSNRDAIIDYIYNQQKAGPNFLPEVKELALLVTTQNNLKNRPKLELEDMPKDFVKTDNAEPTELLKERREALEAERDKVKKFEVPRDCEIERTENRQNCIKKIQTNLKSTCEGILDDELTAFCTQKWDRLFGVIRKTADKEAEINGWLGQEANVTHTAEVKDQQIVVTGRIASEKQMPNVQMAHPTDTSSGAITSAATALPDEIPLRNSPGSPVTSAATSQMGAESGGLFSHDNNGSDAYQKIVALKNPLGTEEQTMSLSPIAIEEIGDVKIDSSNKAKEKERAAYNAAIAEVKSQSKSDSLMMPLILMGSVTVVATMAGGSTSGRGAKASG